MQQWASPPSSEDILAQIDPSIRGVKWADAGDTKLVVTNSEQDLIQKLEKGEAIQLVEAHKRDKHSRPAIKVHSVERTDANMLAKQPDLSKAPTPEVKSNGPEEQPEQLNVEKDEVTTVKIDQE